MLSNFLRLLVISITAVFIGGHGYSQQVSPPYQPLDVRQICGAGDVLDAPAGRIVARPAAGEQVKISDVLFGDDGHLYYRLDHPALEKAYIATENAPHFCGSAARSQPDAAPFAAPPNSCHLIAASRRTIDEVNAFAEDYTDFLPTMSAYRSNNDWYAISLGLISTADAPALLENAPNIPDDAYCADGANYVAVLDFRNDRFTEAVPAAENESDPAVVNRSACLLGDGLACRRYADDLSAQDDQRERDWFEMQRFWLLGCMQGDAQSCVGPPLKLGSGTEYHAVRAAWTPEEPEFSDLGHELLRVGCDAGIVEGCAGLGRRASIEQPQERAGFLTAFQGGLAACAALDEYACRDVFQRFEHGSHRQYQEVMGHPPSAQLRYFAAGLWARGCSAVPGDGISSNCGPVFASYAAFLAAPMDDEGTSSERRAVAIGFLHKGCEAYNADACVYYSRLSEFVPDADRARAAGWALTGCQLYDRYNDICQNIEEALGSETPQVQQRRSDEYQKLAQVCLTDSGMAGAKACSDAAYFYWEKISATDIAELETMLGNACNSKRITGCSSLAFIYSANSATGKDLSFTGINLPEKRLAVLRTGCMVGEIGRPNCAYLADMLEDRGEYQAAQETYRMACGTVRASGDLVPYERGIDSCFEGALVALRQLQDYDAAREGFEIACDANNFYACKHLALMARDGLGREKDADEAFALFQRSCSLGTEERGDGEGCLYYGKQLLADRDRVGWDPDFETYVLTPSPFEQDDISLRSLAYEVSRAFATGCRNRWDAACKAREEFVADWTNGAFPQKSTGCQIRDESDQIISDKSCKLIGFVDIAMDEYDDADLAVGEVYVWPDNDRTLVQYYRSVWKLNGVAAHHTSENDGFECLYNAQTRRSFCTSPE